jgi:CMP-N-acetylneuraminic acid synthetase
MQLQTATISILVNARIHSSRLPRKMVLPFGGTTLIDIALRKLSRMDFVDGRYFAAADEELKATASRYPDVTFLERHPDAVKPGYNGNERVFEHCRRIHSDYIFWLNPCVPLLSLDTVRRVCEEVRRTRFNSYTSVIEFQDWVFDSDGTPITNTQASMLSTAHSKKYYKVAHAFHVYGTERFLKTFVPWTLTRNDPALVEIPQDESFDVNTPLEFEIAEAAYVRAGVADR